MKLAQKEQRLLYRKRKYLADLRCLEKRGKQLDADGVTIENLDEWIADVEISTAESK